MLIYIMDSTWYGKGIVANKTIKITQKTERFIIADFAAEYIYITHRGEIESLGIYLAC